MMESELTQEYLALGEEIVGILVMGYYKSMSDGGAKEEPSGLGRRWFLEYTTTG